MKKKKVKKAIALAAGMLCMSGGATAFAGDAEVDQLKQQMQQVIYQNQQLTARIAELEEMVRASKMSPAGQEQLKAEVHESVVKELRTQDVDDEGIAQKINQYVTLSGLIEAEASFGDDYEGNSTSEFNLATVELGLDAQMSEWAVGHILALYEGPDDDNITIDEGFIQLGNYEKLPLSLTAGKMYMPFGNFETNMIQDPMTLEIGEIGDYGVAVGFEMSGFYSGIYGYNGMKETGSSETIKGFGAMAGYGFEDDNMSFDVGVSWVNDIADSGGIADHFDEIGLETIKDNVNGIGTYLIAGFGPFSFIAEYVTALDEFYPGAFNPETGEVEGAEILFNDNGAEPAAWNAELAYTIELFGNETVFAIGYQGTDEAVELGLPETRYIAAASMALFPGTALTLEYFYDEDYDIGDGGTDKDANVFTTQLAYEF